MRLPICASKFQLLCCPACSIAVDLANVDISLPDVDGTKIAPERCKRLPNCKILLMSSGCADCGDDVEN